MRELYFSTDIETDGPIPGPHSMLSLGCAAFTDEGELIDTFYVTLLPLTGAVADPDTAAWWLTQPEAYEAATRDASWPAVAMDRYKKWVEETARKHDAAPVFVAYPAGFDFMFVYWYLISFTGSSPFSFSALDMKTLAMAKLGRTYRTSVKKNWPRWWTDAAGGGYASHFALDDAIEQGYQFVAMLSDG